MFNLVPGSPLPAIPSVPHPLPELLEVLPLLPDLFLCLPGVRQQGPGTSLLRLLWNWWNGRMKLKVESGCIQTDTP